MKCITLSILAGVLILSFMLCDPTLRTTTELSNIILVMADDQGWGDTVGDTSSLRIDAMMIKSYP